MLELKIKTD